MVVAAFALATGNIHAQSAAAGGNYYSPKHDYYVGKALGPSRCGYVYPNRAAALKAEQHPGLAQRTLTTLGHLFLHRA